MKLARKIAKGTSVLRAVSPRSRHGLAAGSPRSRRGLGMLPTVVLAQTFSEVFGGPFCVAGAALWQPKVQISWQVQYFVPVQGQVQISRQAQYFRKVEYIFRGRRGTFARSGDG